LLSIEDLTIRFGRRHAVTAVDGVGFDVGRGEIVAVVGESGSGKTVTSLALSRLLPRNALIAGGRITFDGEDVLAATEHRMRELRGARIGMVFQNPMSSLNPVLKVGYQVAESLVIHRAATWREARSQAVDLLQRVGIASPARRADDFPFRFSGGMQQRVMLALAYACRPALLIADEPTTALDVTVQAQVLELMVSLKNEFGSSILLITHDLGVVASVADRVVVMRHGRVVEKGDVVQVLEDPQHDYTKQLIAAVPRIDGGRTR